MAATTTTVTISGLRGIVLALMVVPLAILVPMSIVLPDDKLARPEALWLGALVVLLAICALQVATIGYTVTPLEPTLAGDESTRPSMQALQQGTMLRWALAEAVFIVGLALAFVTSTGGLWLVLVGFVDAEVLMLLHVYPSDRVLQRVRDRLERNGGHASFA